MNILFYNDQMQNETWLAMFKTLLPQATIHLGDNPKTYAIEMDYALVWKPTPAMLSHRHSLKAIFMLGAGVDSLLDQVAKMPELLPPGVPVYRLEDAGMAEQMQEYATAFALRYFRRFDEYQHWQHSKQWHYLAPYRYDEFTIGVMGVGVLGEQVARRLADLGFTVKGWSRVRKAIDKVQTYAQDELAAFLTDTKLIINLLPSTPATRGILNRALFAQLLPASYLINMARGAHLVDNDLLDALASKQLQAATLDVFQQEPLPKQHPFWHHPNITITPHVAALTRAEDALQQIIEKINLIEQNKPITTGRVDLTRGY